MGSYLENYLESVSSLPQEVRRNFALLRELDSRSQDLLEKVEKSSKQLLSKSAKRAKENPDDEKTIRSDLKQCLELGDEKVALAVQTYELVDKHIRRLDMDLKKFEAELEQQGTPVVATPIKEHKAVEKKAVDSKTPQKKNGTAADPSARVLNVDIDMPIDPNEPTYCICSRVSFGEMVGCDSSDCKVEWFHFECVGLTGPPKGKWFCPDCTASRKKQRVA
eukprot:TRINITY_DN7109_c0_g1_i1.p1 TRINITY_DN7109_c0_g1~~TRINITY_DN7109_c0_g1_i1.p1  ORF type:complete len:221 (+),score=39.82 TRINITY_DN7109_c0_g1_i1:204-866(+)